MTIDVRERIQAELFDYQTLVDALGELSFPRDKITDLIRKRIIIRIKKGLYIFGDRYRKHPYSRELLANLIYGPSYVSLDYALDFYGFIPERSEALTSVTLRRSRKFRTPAGLFIYHQIPVQAYQAGMVRAEGDNGQAFLIASPEKALADKIISERGVAFTSPTGMRQYLIESLRIDISNIQSLSLERIDEYAGRYRSRKLRHLGGLVRRLQKSNEGIPYE